MDEDEAKEGILCPICLENFVSVHGLSRHYELEHDQGTTKNGTQNQNVFTVDDSMVTRDHWVEDKAECMAPKCNVNFNFPRTRHHCRRCGKAFCEDHSRWTLKLNKNAIPDFEFG
eukprot:Pgem_evm1s16255